MKASVGSLVWLSVVLVLLGCAQSLYADTDYNIVTGFSATTNPNGVWTYQLNGASYTDSQGSSNPIGAGLPGWWNGGSVPDSLLILQNVTGSTVSYLTINDPTGTLWLDPESGNVSVVFTAPLTGTYNITGDFLGIDTGENSHPVEILEDGTTVLYNGTISSYGGEDSFSGVSDLTDISLNAGDTITFEVLTGSSGCTYCNLSTGLQGDITEVGTTPEPSSLILFGSGLLAMAYLLRRKRFAQS